MRAETIAEQLFFITGFLQGKNNDGGTWTGTGFLINYPVENDHRVAVLVTNKHVLSDAVQLTIRFVRAGEDNSAIAEATETTIVDFGPDSWVGHPDRDVDIAVMFAGPILNGMTERGAPAFTRAFLPEHLLTEAQAQELDAIENVTFIGYPNGLFDTANFLPIARRGQTATPLQNNYQGRPSFLVDASVFPGSSGSPVVIFDRGTYTKRDGAAYVGNRFHLVGVLAAVHQRSQVGDLVQLPTRTVAVVAEPIDLGIVFKANAIQECVDLLFAGAGVQVTPPSEPLEGSSASGGGHPSGGLFD